MIWVIASIPFWILAVVIFAFGVAGMVMAFDTAYLDRHNLKSARNGQFVFGLLCLPISGVVALLAAKICS